MPQKSPHVSATGCSRLRALHSNDDSIGPSPGLPLARAPRNQQEGREKRKYMEDGEHQNSRNKKLRQTTLSRDLLQEKCCTLILMFICHEDNDGIMISCSSAWRRLNNIFAF